MKTTPETNCNDTSRRRPVAPCTLKLRTKVKAGLKGEIEIIVPRYNHNQTVCTKNKVKRLKLGLVRTNVKAGRNKIYREAANHN